MNPERWRRIEEIFRTAIDRPATDRDAYLTQVCGGDEDLRQEVLTLLELDVDEDFICDPIANVALSLTTKSNDDLTGERIGPYRVTRLIGSGGMGDVYEAERDDEQFSQQVAIKIIKRGMDTDYVRNRFLRERQILATLDHPHIARLFDGGATRDGLPYFVMEFVAGEPITASCRRRQLSVNEKLKLFRKVCSAVQHAHQRLVIHRDLKPSNILIAENGEPTLLDFGIAKLLSPDVSQEHTRTETAYRMMTPEYASPEQARGQAVATTTDVYSLGVVLYELLTGRRPYEFKTYSPAEIERAIWGGETEEPSKVVSRMSDGRARLSRQLAGDLDNIVMMAIRKEPERRYQSVEQFSEDIRRHLAGLPVLARKDTFGYRAGKFVRRHKAGVVILSLLAAFTVALAALAVRIAHERDRANQAAATAQAVTDSLVSVLDFADPGKSRGNAITAKELLDQSAEKVVRGLKDQPAVQAKLIDTIGGLYQSIGEYDRAQPLLEEALKLRRQALGAEHADVAASLHSLGALAYDKGDFAGGETRFRESLELRRKLLGTERPEVGASMGDLGKTLLELGKLAEAEPLLREALALRRRLLGEEHEDVADSLNGLGRLLSKQGKFAEAAVSYGQALELYRRHYGEEHPYVAAGLSAKAGMLQEMGDYNGAEPLFREALKLQFRLLGAEHPDVAQSLSNLASLLQDKREYDEAENLYRQALELRIKLFGESNPRLTITMNNLATLLREKGDYVGAEALFRQALALRRKMFEENHPEIATSISNLGGVYFDKGQYDEAMQFYRQALDRYLKSLTPDHWMVSRTRSYIGGCMTRLKRYREAEEQLLAAHAGLKSVRGDQNEVTRKTVSRLIELYEAWGKPDQAGPYRALPQANEK